MCKDLIYRFCLLALAAGFSQNAASAEECLNAKTPVERIICKTPALRVADRNLQKTYDANVDLANETGATRLRLAQRSWLSSVRNQCLDAPCLEGSYGKRIEELLGMLLDRYQDQHAHPLISNALIERGSVGAILRLESGPKREELIGSFGASISTDVLASVRLNPKGRMLIELQSVALHGIAVRYWDPNSHVEWIPEVAPGGDTTARIAALSQFNAQIRLGLGDAQYLTYEHGEDCILKSATKNVRYTSCQRASTISFGDSANLIIFGIQEGATCLDSFGLSAYLYAPYGTKPAISRTPLLLMNQPVTSLLGGRPYCIYDTEIASDDGEKIRHRVIEPDRPEWAAPLDRGAVIILGSARSPHSNVRFFYRLVGDGFSSFNDKRMKLIWVDTDWLIANGYLMGKNGTVRSRVMAMDQFLTKQFQEK